MKRRADPRSTLKPRKSPRQARARSTVEAIVEAGARVLAAESLAGFNTNRVAEVAGVSVGSLYQYFPNKAALMAALVERAQRGLAATIAEVVAATDGDSLEASIELLAEAAIEHQFASPLLAAAIDHEERRLPLESLLGEVAQEIVASVLTLLGRHRATIAAPCDETTAADCLAIARSLVESAPSLPPAGRRDLCERLVRALLGYLLLPRAPGGPLSRR